MLAYRHAFHAGNHADVLKHLVFLQVLEHLNLKDKGWRCVDTHAGAGGYSLQGTYANKTAEWRDGVGRLWSREDLPPPLAFWRQQVQAFNGGDELRQYPGSPALAAMRMRPQDQLRLCEAHPTDHKILSSYLGDQPGVEVRLGDGFDAVRRELPPPTKRGVLLIDPSYEIKTDYTRVLAALREALQRFATGVVVIWLPQLALLEAAQLPQRLKASADTAPKGWLHARLTVVPPDAQGFGMLGSSVFVANPPHGLADALQAVLPYLAQVLGRWDGAHGQVERSVRG